MNRGRGAGRGRPRSTSRPRRDGSRSASSSSDRAEVTPTTNSTRFTSAAMTTMAVTDARIVPTGQKSGADPRRPKPTPPELPTPPSTPSLQISLVTLGAIVGALSVIVIALALFLFWRKRRQAMTSSKDKHDTYHMYSEIDHTTIILSDETTDVSTYRDKVVRGPPPPIPSHDYDELTFIRESQANPNYSKLDPKQVNMNDPRLSNYDSTTSMIENGKSANHPNGDARSMGTSPPEKLEKRESENNNHMPCRPISEGNNYFQLEEGVPGEDTPNDCNDNEKKAPDISSDINDSLEGDGNYFLVEKDDTVDSDTGKEE